MTRPTGHVFRNLFALGVIAFFCQPAQVQDGAPQNSEAQEREATGADSHQSGYEDITEFGGPDSVRNELKRNDAAREPRYQFDALPTNFGHSNGGGGVAAEDAVSAGMQFTQSFDKIWTVGVGWANPSSTTFEPGLDDEFLIETSYKFQLSRNFSLTPDLQFVVNPAGNPEENSIWIFGIRAILTL